MVPIQITRANLGSGFSHLFKPLFTVVHSFDLSSARRESMIVDVVFTSYRQLQVVKFCECTIAEHCALDLPASPVQSS